ncbi:MAG: pentapeptide repeat-containing protein [Candidatus Eisenbacteria bacterium]|nr:pentapeptide repeat-containing protein [Candidatus Eisenbacteria bacterium]
MKRRARNTQQVPDRRAPTGVPDAGPEFVNHGPDGRRCEYVFLVDVQINRAEPSGQVRLLLPRGRKCGLPQDRAGDRLCYWHRSDPDKAGDLDLKARLEAAVKQGVYLGGAFLSGGGPGTHLDGPHGPLDLSGAVLDVAYLPGAYLQGTILRGASLRSAHLEAAFCAATDLSGADLMGAHLFGCDFEGSVLAGAEFWDAELDNGTRLDGVDWGRDHILATERKGLHSNAETAYRGLKQHRQDAGDYHAAGEFFYREMESIRRQLSWRRRLVWTIFFKSLCGYGERPTWTFRWALGVILVWGLVVFPLAGIRNPDATRTVLTWPLTLRPFLDGLSLSLITFATLGYGNRYPTGAAGEYLAGCEALLGILLSSLFVVSFAKKVIRG